MIHNAIGPGTLTPLNNEELMQTNGGIGPLGLLGIELWINYLLEHEEQFFDGLADGWNEFSSTLTN
ncbi:MAG: class IIb bacteriocin, lactobin A/cerein 7B family [Bacteroidales bacterium]|nr:class IIb bacteriocin, lactobin A/cerein 7B family [Bacteroidales bacterium]